jgi:hypothetical protein
VTRPDAEYAERLELAADELDRLARRLRSFTPRLWVTYADPVHDGLERLVEVGIAAERTTDRLLVPPPDHALADAYRVVVGDALEALAATPDDALLDRLVAELREVLAATR